MEPCWASNLKAAAAYGWLADQRQEVFAYFFCTVWTVGRAAMLDGLEFSPPPPAPHLVIGDVGLHGGLWASALETVPDGRRSDGGLSGRLWAPLVDGLPGRGPPAQSPRPSPRAAVLRLQLRTRNVLILHLAAWRLGVDLAALTIINFSTFSGWSEQGST